MKFRVHCGASAFSLAWLIFGSGVAVAAATVDESERSKQADALFARWDKPTVPGAAVAVIHRGKIVYERGFGAANLEYGIPVKPETVFHVASVSKQFTAAAILLLAQDGKLTLDDEVRKHVPDLPDFGHPITIRHLLHHTSGIRDQWSLLGLAGWRYSRDLITDDDVLSLLSRQKELNFLPGERHLYSNSGFTLLAVIVSRVSGQSFRAFTSERIFKPLGMTQTHFRDNFNEVVKQQAYGYSRSADGFQLSTTNFDTAGATSLLTTVEDLAKWHANFDKKTVGGEALAAAMLERGVLSDGRRIDYASGIMHGSYRGVPTVGHGGADAGYRAAFVRFPEQRFGVAVLCNLAQTNPTDLAQRVADVFLGDVLKPATTSAAASPAASRFLTLPEVPLTPEALAALAGTYWNATEAMARRFVVDGGALAVQTGGQTHRLKSLGDGLFVMTAAPWWQMRFKGPSVQIGTAQSPGDMFVRSDPFAPSATELDDFAGIYRSDEMDVAYRMVVRDGRLRLERLKANPAGLEPVVRDTFSSPAGVFRFTRDGQGKVNGFVLEAGRVRGVKFWRDTRPSRP